MIDKVVVFTGSKKDFEIFLEKQIPEDSETIPFMELIQHYNARLIFIQTVIQENKAISFNHPVHSLQGAEIFAKHDIDTKLPCNFKRVSGTAAFYQFLTDP